MLLAEELEMWEEKTNNSIDERAQEDEQFVMEIENEETSGSESSSAGKKSEQDDQCWKSGSDPNRADWVSGTLVQGLVITRKGQSKKNARSTRHSKIKFGRRGIRHEKERA